MTNAPVHHSLILVTFLSKIQTLLRAMDDDALAALANRGLLRRAKKDLETITPQRLNIGLEERERCIRLEVEDCEVTIPEIPAEARSNSPAGTIDRYVLIAFLWLRDQANIETETSEEQGMRPETLEDAALIAWAGKAAFRKTEKRLDGNLRCLIESERPLVIRIPERNIVCRWIEGGNLETMIVTGPGKTPKEDGLLALMLYRIEKGVRSFPSQQIAEVLSASDGAPRSRLEVLSSLGDVLQEMVFFGLTRLSEATRHRLQGLAVSAHGVDLPRLERMIRSLADEIHLHTSRNALGSTSGILWQAVRLDALRRALMRRFQGDDAAVSSGQIPISDLLGEHRSRYHSVGALDLIGMGARQWRTKSGYVGVSVYFWDASSKRWATWSQSRPGTTPDFDPMAAFHGEGPWSGCPSPAFASRNLLKLLDAYRNDNGRLSARKQTQAIPLPIDDTDAMILPPPFVDWNDVHTQAKRLFRGGLVRRDERDEIVFLKAELWLEATFDDAEQTLYRTMIDDKGRPLTLMLPYEAGFGKAEAIRRLEKYDPSDHRGVLGLIRLHRNQIMIEPVSLFDSGGIRSLTLEHKATSKIVRSWKIRDPEESAEDEQQSEEFQWSELPPESGPIGVLLEVCLSELEALAESGLGGSTLIRENTQLERLAKQFESLGFEMVSNHLKQFLNAYQANQRQSRRTGDREPDAASAYFQVCYVIHIATQAAQQALSVP